MWHGAARSPQLGALYAENGETASEGARVLLVELSLAVLEELDNLPTDELDLLMPFGLDFTALAEVTIRHQPETSAWGRGERHQRENPAATRECAWIRTDICCTGAAFRVGIKRVVVYVNIRASRRDPF